MPVFRFKAAHPGGEVVEGEMEAANQEAVIRRIQAQGQVPIRAEEVRSAALPKSAARTPLFQSRRMTQRDVSLFTLELSTLLKAGLPLDRALDMLAKLTDKPAIREVVAGLQTEVRGGAFLSRAMEARDRVFSRFYRNMVRAGEATGALDQALARLSEFMQRSRELQDTVVSALIYPIILFVVACASLAIILGVVVPRISEMFVQAGQELPWFTQLVVNAGDFVQSYGWAIALVIVGAALYMRHQYRDPNTRLRWDARMLRAPLIGDFVAKLEAARFTRTLGTLLGSGVPLLDALAIAKEIVANRLIASAIERAAGRVREGEGLAKPLQESAVFPKLASNLLEVGEETGNLEPMLMQLAEIYEREVQSTLRRLVAILEPVLILGLAVVIAGIIMSMVVAIFSVNDLAF